MSLATGDSHLKNQLASDWMHQGINLANENSVPALERAIRCFDEAIALRRTLPLDENPFFRYGLSAGWINRSDALTQLDRDSSLVEAVKSYDEALALLESLSLEENVLYPRRLAITFINKGIALQKQKALSNVREAAVCYRKAIAVLEHASATSVADRSSLLAGACLNLASALMSANENAAKDIRSTAHKTLTLVQATERTEILSAEMGLKTRHILCRLALKDIANKEPLSKDAVAEATDAVDEALALALHWKSQSLAEFENLACDIFRFGCRIYENNQPHFLAEFLMEYLSPKTFGEIILRDQETLNAVQATIWSAVDKLQQNGFQRIAAPHFETFLSNIQELREVEEQLKQLHFDSTFRGENTPSSPAQGNDKNTQAAVSANSSKL